MKNNIEYFKTLTKEQILKKIKTDEGNSFVSINEAFNEQSPIIGVKDIHVQQGVISSSGSKILSEYTGNYESTVTKLLKAAGFAIVGSLNMDEFAMGFDNSNSYYGTVKNAHNEDYVAGGSSGGSAYAVAKGLIPVATGTDTGGSIRQPAAFNKIYGLKPTYGLVSRYGTIAFASSLDTIGVLSNTIEDNATVLEILAQNDLNDQTNYVPENYEAKSLINSDKKLKIGYVKEWLNYVKDDQVGQEIQKQIELFKNNGYEVEEVSIPTVKYAFELYMILAYSEASSNLSRYDGMRFGINNETNDFATYRRNFGNEVKKRLVIGGYMTSSAHSKEYFKKAQQIRSKMIEEIQKVFKTYDILLGPVTFGEGIKVGEHVDDKVGYLYDFFLIPANMTGIPSMSVPIADLTNGMGISIQVLANKYEEKKIYNIAKKIESWRNNE